MKCLINPVNNSTSDLYTQLNELYNEEIADNIYAKIQSDAFIEAFGNWTIPYKEKSNELYESLTGRVYPKGGEPWLKYNKKYNYYYFELLDGKIYAINNKFINFTDEQKQALIVNSIKYLSGDVISKEDLGEPNFRELYQEESSEGKLNISYILLDGNKSALRELEDELRVFYNLTGQITEDIDNITGDRSDRENDRDGLGISSSYENNSKDNASANIKFMFSYIPKYNADGTRKQIEFDVRGETVAIQDYMSYHEIWNYFEETLANILPTLNGDTFEDAYDKMINTLREKYGEGSKYENNSVKDALAIIEQFPDYKQNQFVLAFTKAKISFYTTTIDNSETGKVRLVFFNSGDVTSRSNKIKKEIISGLQKGPLVDNVRNKYNPTIAVKAREKFEQIRKENADNGNYTVEEGANEVRTLLSQVGININVPTLINYIDHQDINYEEIAPEQVEQQKLYKALDELKWLFKDLAEAKQDKVFEKDKFNNPLSQSSPINQLAEAEAEFRKDIQENTVTGPDNKSYWSYSLPNYLNIKLNNLKNDLENTRSKSAFYRNSTWLKGFKESKNFRDNFEVLNFLNLKLDDQGDAGVDNKQINIQDQTVDLFNKAVSIFKKTDSKNPYSILNTPAPAEKARSMSFKINKIHKSGFRIKDGEYDFSQDLVKVYKGYLLDEYSRIIEVSNKVNRVRKLQNALKEAEENNNKSDIEQITDKLDVEKESLYQYYHYGKDESLFTEYEGKLVPVGNGFKFSLFEELNYDNDLSKTDYKDLGIFSMADDTDVILPAITLEELENSHLINKLIENKLKQHLNNQVTALEELSLVKATRNDKNVVTNISQNNFIDSEIFEHYNGLHDNPNEAILDFIFESSINQHIANVEYNKTFSGDYAYYKSLEDYSKRVPATYTDGVSPNNGKDDNTEYTMAVGTEVKVFTDLYPKKGDKDKPSVDANDAQGYITYDRWKYLVRRLNKYSPKVEDMIDRFEEGRAEPEDYQFAAQPLKGVYFDNKNGIPTFVKYSAFVLLEDVTKGNRSIDNLRRNMEEQGIDEFVALSGVKSGGITISETFDEDYNYKTDMKFYKQSMSNAYWKKQQDLTPKGIKQTLLGSQMQWNIIGDLSKNSTYNGKTGRERVSNVNSLVSQLSNIHFNKLQKSIGLNPDTGEISNREAFHELLLAEIQRNGGDKNSLEALKKQYPLDVILSNRTKYQNLISAVINNAGVNIKTNGASFIQASSLGWNKYISKDDVENNVEDSESGIKMLVENDKLQPPTLYKDAEGKKRVRPGQVFMTHNQIAKFIPNYRELPMEQLKEMIDDRLRYVVGYRIPNQDLASNDALEIVGILPESMGDTILPYLDITNKTGSDFDIDKMYLMMPNIKPVYNFKKKINDALFAKPTEELVSYLLNDGWEVAEITQLTQYKDKKGEKKNELVKLIYESTDIGSLKEFTGLEDIKVDRLDYYQDDVAEEDANIEVVSKYDNKMVKSNPGKIFVFGDNTQRTGKGGQAQIRDNENAIGIATKLKPSNSSNAFMTDNQLEANKKIIDNDIAAILSTGKQVVFPKDGLGTGLAKLEEKAPKTYAYLRTRLLEEFGFDNDTGQKVTNDANADQSTKAVENKLLQEFIEILTAPELYNQLKQSIDNPRLQNDLEKLHKLGEKKRSQFDFFSPTAQLQKKFDNSAGKAGTGIMSNHRVDLTKAQIAELSINEDLGVGHIQKDGTTSLHEIKGTDNVRISEMISLFLTAYVDIAKDPYITKGNHNTVTANTTMLLLRAGAPLTWINRFIGQEGIFRYAYLENNKDSKFNPSKGNMIEKTIDEYWEKIKEVRGTKDFDEYQEEKLEGITDLVMDGEAIRNHEKFKESYMEGQIQSEPENNDDKITYYLDQIMYLKAYERYNDIGGKLNNTVVYSKADVNGAKPTYMENKLYMKGYNEMFEAKSGTMFGGLGPLPLFNNLMGKFNNTMLGTKHRNSVNVANKIFKNELVTASPFSNYIYDSYMDSHPYASKKELKALEGSVYGYIVSKNRFFNEGETHSTKLKELLSDKLQNKVADLRLEYSDNALLRALEFETVEGFHFLKLENFKNKPITFKNDLIRGWEELHEIDTEFSEDLIKYTFATSNFQFNSNTFFEFIPYNIVRDLIEPVVNEFKVSDRVDMLEGFFDFHYRHNTDIVPNMKISAQEEMYGVPYTEPGKYGATFVKRKQSSTYIKNEGTRGDIDLFKFVGETEKEDVNLYIRVSKLGFKKRGYNIYEHNLPEGSIISKNRVTLSENKLNNIRELLNTYGYSTTIGQPIADVSDFYTGPVDVTEDELYRINQGLGTSYSMKEFQNLSRTQKETLKECYGNG